MVNRDTKISSEEVADSGIFTTIRHSMSLPFIYGMIFPSVFLHVILEIYHQVCFRLYGIPLVNSDDFFVYDRVFMKKLTPIEKAHCYYCSYVNNLFLYASEIAGRTERYWCPLKYARRMKKQHSHYKKFIDEYEEENFREKWEDLRDFRDL